MSHRRVPFQRIYNMILSSELQSDGRDTEPRGMAVKGQRSRAQGEGERGGRKNNTLRDLFFQLCRGALLFVEHK